LCVRTPKPSPLNDELPKSVDSNTGVVPRPKCFDIDFFKSPTSYYNKILPINILTYENNAKIQNLVPKQSVNFLNGIVEIIQMLMI
jgi:hypothetical protein